MNLRLAYVSARLKSIFAYRLELGVSMINPLLQLVLLAAVWRAVYAGRDSVDSVPLTAMTTYVSIAAVHTLIARDDAINWIEKRIRTGVISMDMVRPVSVLQQTMCGQLAQLLTKFPLMLILAPVALVFSDITAPKQPAAYALAALLGWLVNCCVFLLLSAISFWTLEVGGLMFLFFVINGFLSGALVPLWFMPDWLATTLSWLPMQAIVYTPVAIYVGQIAGNDVWHAIGVQTAWFAALAMLVALVWRRAVHKVVVQGG